MTDDNNFDINSLSANSSEDDFVIGKGFTVSEYSTEKNGGNKKKRRKRGANAVKNIIWVLAIVVISCGIAFAAIYAGADFLGIGFGRGENCVVEIPSGASTATIAEKLSAEDVNAVKWPFLFRVYSKLKGYDGQYKYGIYSFNNEAGYEELANMLITEGAKAESVTVTIPEGTGINDYVKNVNGEDVTVKGIATILEEKGICERADLIAAFDSIDYKTRLLENVNQGKVYHALEGYLFPETYEFYAASEGGLSSEESAKLAVERMIKELDSRITDAMYKRADELGYSMNEILTMASIIQMETGNNAKELPHVAAIFYNRLNSDDFATLGSSPTCYYGNSFKQDDGRYDTYTAKGLPPGPLCSPGIEAIKAALYPTENVPYYYFVTDSDGNFYYHKTLAEQNATIAKLQRGDKWIYEYFD